MKILIVDDHPVIIAGCSAMFAAESKYDVVDASTTLADFERSSIFRIPLDHFA
jgi:DNA-binding NarL/FixJ family response regulator